MFREPAWTITLFTARARYFFSRQLKHPLKTPDQFVIESASELISYWSFFVERECWSHEWVSALVSESEPLVVDVGANAGLFTHRIWTLQPRARFIVFEPLPRMAKKIEQWKQRTGTNLVLHNTAVSDRNGTASFYASEDNDPTASLKSEGKRSLEFTVPVVTLDSVLPDKPILLLKIDVEGCECEVLSGARRTLEQSRFLLIEAHTKDALARLRHELGSPWQVKQVGASDFLFTRANESK